MPQSDATSATNDQTVIYGTGLTSAELKQIGYSDAEIAQMRSDSQQLMAQNNGAEANASTMPQSDQSANSSMAQNNATAQPGTASGNQDQAPSAANGVSQPSDTNNNANQPQKASSSNYAGLWGLLGLLGLIGLAGRSRRQVVVDRSVDTTMTDRDRLRMMAERDATNREARDREIVAHDRDMVARDYRDQDVVASDMRDRDVMADSPVQENLRAKEIRDKVREMREEDRNRRRTA
jgi:hypothetical protein